MKEEYPAVSVVIVTYNSESNIDQCLKSLADTNYPSYEVIIADNKSTDRSLEIISNYAHSCTILKNEDNYGFAGGVNRAVTVAKGEYLVLLNPDCFVTPDWLTHLITPLKLRCVGATGATLLYPETQIIQSAGGSINSFGFTRHYGYRNPYRSDDKNRAVEYVTGAALATKKELFSTVGGFDEEYYPVYFEEIDYCRLLRNIGYHILYVPKAVVYHAESQSVTLNSDNYFYWYHRGRLRFISKQINGWVDMIFFLFKECSWLVVYHFIGLIKSLVTFDKDGVLRKIRSFRATFKAYRDVIHEWKIVSAQREEQKELRLTVPNPHSL